MQADVSARARTSTTSLDTTTTDTAVPSSTMANLISRISLFALALVALVAYLASTGQAAKGPVITNKVRPLPQRELSRSTADWARTT